MMKFAEYNKFNLSDINKEVNAIVRVLRRPSFG